MLVGDDSPHIDQVVEMNGRMLPEETDFIKVWKLYEINVSEQGWPISLQQVEHKSFDADYFHHSWTKTFFFIN